MTCYLTNKWMTLGVFFSKKILIVVIFHIYQEQNAVICLSSSFLFYDLQIRKAVKYISVLILH